MLISSEGCLFISPHFCLTQKEHSSKNYVEQKAHYHLDKLRDTEKKALEEKNLELKT